MSLQFKKVSFTNYYRQECKHNNMMGLDIRWQNAMEMVVTCLCMYDNNRFQLCWYLCVIIIITLFCEF